MEQRDLYNKNKELTGKIINKGDPIPDNYYILVVAIVLENDNNELLIQKRSPEKGGKWAFTGGHPKHGETSLEGIKTEVEEELGIKIKNPTLFKEVQDKDAFCDLYYLKENISLKDLSLQEEEVSDAKYATIEEIEKMYEVGEFKKGHYKIFKDYLEYIKK